MAMGMTRGKMRPRIIDTLYTKRNEEEYRMTTKNMARRYKKHDGNTGS